MPEPKSTSRISLFFLSQTVPLKRRRLLKRFIPDLFRRELRTLASLNLIFCSDEYLLRINEQYLGHADYTDIITFDLSDSSQSIVAEIYISLDRVRENSVEFNSRLHDELHRVIFHGLLHLCGYKDKTASQKKEIRRKEDEYLRLYKLFVSRETRST